MHAWNIVKGERALIPNHVSPFIALEEGIPITTPAFFASEEQLPDKEIERIFRSDTKEQVPLLHDRIRVIREAGRVLVEVRLFCVWIKDVLVVDALRAKSCTNTHSCSSS